jgi:hypothetical protein
MKTCKYCEQLKPLTEFYKNKTKSDGLTIYCKDCSKEKERIFHKNNPHLKKFRNRKHMLDSDKKSITYDTFSKMLNEQDNKCGICNTDMKKPYIDHNHNTGLVRMLLCHYCNTLLGMAKEDIKILENAIGYIHRFK